MGKFLLKTQQQFSSMPVQSFSTAAGASPNPGSAVMLNEEIMSNILGRTLMRGGDPLIDQAAKHFISSHGAQQAGTVPLSSSSFKIEDILNTKSLSKEVRADRNSRDSSSSQNSPAPASESNNFAGIPAILQNSLNNVCLNLNQGKANFSMAQGQGLAEDKYSNASSISPSSFCSPISSSMSSPYQQQQRIENPLALKAQGAANELFMANGFPLSLNAANSIFGQFSSHLANVNLAQQQQNSFMSTYSAIFDQIALSQKSGLMPPFGLDFLKNSIMANELGLKVPAELLAENQKALYMEAKPSFDVKREQSTAERPNATPKTHSQMPFKEEPLNTLPKSSVASSHKEDKKAKKKAPNEEDDASTNPQKKAKREKIQKSKMYGECDCAANCTELAMEHIRNATAASMSIDQHQLPMCLRGASEEQLHLASLFNSLIHHKKCRRTRTVFTDMQLIGLERRFENQKYLSTPDRIQLADSLGLSQLQVKTWYQNRRMKWKKKVLKDGCQDPPTKPKGRPKKNSIPSLSDILKARAETANSDNNNNKSTGSSSASTMSSCGVKNSNTSMDSQSDDDDESMEDYNYSSDNESEMENESEPEEFDQEEELVEQSDNKPKPATVENESVASAGEADVN